MNSVFAERLSKAFVNSDIQTKSQLAELVGITPQYLHKILSGDAKQLPPADVTLKLAKALKIDYSWLITGTKLNELSDSVRPGEASDECIPIASYNISLSCGNGCYSPSFEIADESPVYFKKSWFSKHSVLPEDCRRLKAHGDSMEPVILDGDYITVDCSEYAKTHIQNNKIYALIIDDMLYCKYLIKQLDGTVIIRSANPTYPEDKIAMSDFANRVYIIGKVLDRSGDLS